MYFKQPKPFRYSFLTNDNTYVDYVDQDQTAQNVQSDLWSTLPTFSFYIITESFLYLKMEVHY